METSLPRAPTHRLTDKWCVGARDSVSSYWRTFTASLTHPTCARLAVLLCFGISTSVLAQDNPHLTPVDKQQIEAALKITREGAAKYRFTIGQTPPEQVKLHAEPVLRWSNPAAGEIHGNVFLWTIHSRPVVVGSLYQWFSPHTHLSHEFQSLSEDNVSAEYEEKDVWTTSEPGLKFQGLPDAPPPAASAAQRLLQMKKLSKSFTATKTERDGNQSELRLLTQPVYRYAAEQEGLIDGALFTFVQGTDPEVFLLLEARKQEGKAVWQFAATRMNSVKFELRYHDREVWSREVLPWADVASHQEVYTTFQFKK
jgi:hypothetical protein